MLRTLFIWWISREGIIFRSEKEFDTVAYRKPKKEIDAEKAKYKKQRAGKKKCVT